MNRKTQPTWLERLTLAGGTVEELADGTIQARVPILRSLPGVVVGAIGNSARAVAERALADAEAARGFGLAVK